MEPDPVEFAPLLNVSDDVPLSALREMPVLRPVIDRLLADLSDPNGVISAFGSYIADS